MFKQVQICELIDDEIRHVNIVKRPYPYTIKSISFNNGRGYFDKAVVNGIQLPAHVFRIIRVGKRTNLNVKAPIAVAGGCLSDGCGPGFRFLTRRLPYRFYDVDLNQSRATANDIEFCGGGVRQIDDPVFMKRPSVIDSDYGLFAIFKLVTST